MTLSISEQVKRLGTGALTESSLKEHIWPLFSRSLDRTGQIYLANHSLGRPLDQTALDVQEGLDLWYSRMDDAWDEGGWMGEVDRFRANVARLIGLSDPKAVVPKTSAGQGLRAVLNSFGFDRPVNVVTTRGEFDSVDFILKAYAAKGRVEIRWIEPSRIEEGIPLFGPGDVLEGIVPGTDLVVMSQIVFATGQVMPGIRNAVSRAHAVGALALVDAYHAAGVVPVHMEAMDADFMLGGSYKYIRGGPGACWLAVHPRNVDRVTLDTGWFAKQNPFGYERPDFPERSEGGDGWLESTPPVLTAYQARAGLELTLALGVDRLREYNLGQQAHLRAELLKNGVACFQPDDPCAFGAFTLIPGSDASAATRKLRESGINTDARGNAVRLGPDILNTLEELSRAARIASGDLSRE